MTACGGKLFDVYRTIGLVTDDIPFAIHRNGRKRYITASIGRSFVVYDLDQLTIQIASLPGKICSAGGSRITALTSAREHTFLVQGLELQEWVRGKLSRTLLSNEQALKLGIVGIESLVLFGNRIVLACRGNSENGNEFIGSHLVVVDIADGDVVMVISLDERADDAAKSTSRSRAACSNSAPFIPSTMMHPDTYLNKIVVGSNDGRMVLVNIKTGNVIHQFALKRDGNYSESDQVIEKFGKDSTRGILCIEQSPAVDVVGIGFSDGRIILHNLRLDTQIFSLEQNSPVTSISFRTGGQSQKNTLPPFAMMSSGSANGDIMVWDLDERRLATAIRNAHDGKVVRQSFLPNEPLLVSAGADNCIKLYIFDQHGSSPRLLKMRQGHYAPPTKIRYCGGDTVSTLSGGADASCCQILSAGRDRSFRLFHSAREQLNRELSQGPLTRKAKNLDVKVDELKLPRIVDFVTTEARQKDWCNIISAHDNEGACFTWSLENRVIGDKVLRLDGKAGGVSLKKLATDQITAGRCASKLPATLCVALSVCGNFGISGTESGAIFKYNMQSGLPRGTFPKPRADDEKCLSSEELKARKKKRRRLDAANVQLLENIDTDPLQVELNGTDTPDVILRGNKDKHFGPVRGVGIDSSNSTLISAGSDGTIRLWDFVSHELLSVIDVGSPCALMVGNRDANLFAVALENLSVVVIDATTGRIMRRLRGHTAPVLDMAINVDARWLAVTSSDTSLRIWDLPTARCIEWLEFPSPVTSLSFSPTNEFLATTFANSVGITLWANKVYFGAARSDKTATVPVKLVPPCAVEEEDYVDELRIADGSTRENSNGSEADIVDKVELASSCDEVCLSGLSSSKWYTLTKLDMIKTRNKPIEPPEKPKQAPFFLTTSQGVNPVLVGPSETTEDDPKDESYTETVLAEAGDWDSSNDTDDISENQWEDQMPRSRILDSRSDIVEPQSKLFQLLETASCLYSAEPKGDQDAYQPVVEHMKSLTPSAIDFELHSIGLGATKSGAGIRSLGLLLDWLLVMIHAKTNFELSQAILSRLLKIHGETLCSEVELCDRLGKLLKAQEATWIQLRSSMQHSLCLLSLFSRQQ